MEYRRQLLEHGSEYIDCKLIQLQSGIGKFWVTLCPVCGKRIFDICPVYIFAAICIKCLHCRNIVGISVLSS